MSQETPQKIIYPDQLNITINTSIPGYQKIEYKPYMTIKDIDDRRVHFNPLVKLKKSTIDSIPKEYKIKEFFNKGLFQSLLNYNNRGILNSLFNFSSGTTAKSLLQATRAGYVDNNIKITLDTIFPVGSVIYIGNKPYAIGDIQWNTGDWTMDIKQKKEEIDLNRVNDPRLYSKLVREEIISGEDELSQIPPLLRSGVNYNGPIVNVGDAETPSDPSAPVAKGISASIPQNPIKPPRPIDSQELQPIIPENQITNYNGGPSQELVKMPFKPPKPIISSNKVEEISPEELKLCQTFKEEFKENISKNNSVFFRNYFKIKPGRDAKTRKTIDSKFGQLIQKIFLKFPTQLKQNIDNFLYLTTGYERPKNISSKQLPSISPTAYELSCDRIDILNAPVDGNCFFQAVADSINIYNCENETSKIIYLNYGKTLLFTSLIIRQVVLTYIRSFPQNQIAEMLSIAQNYIEDLNNAFDNSIRGLEKQFSRNLTPNEYLENLINIYNSHENFLIYKPKNPPIDIDEYYKPFRVLKSNEIETYILSKDYWANEFAIEAICSILKICIITIQKKTHENRLTIRTKQVDRLLALLQNIDKVNEGCSKKVMFLFNSNNHYELIRFKYKNKKIQITNKYGNKEELFMDKWYTIFVEGDLPPPIFILFLIYGSIYVSLPPESKETFKLYSVSMKLMNDSVIQNLIDQNKATFIKLYEDTFPETGKYITNILNNYNIQQTSKGFTNPQIENGNGNDSKIYDIDGGNNQNIFRGGEPPYYQNPYQQNPYQPNPYQPNPYQQNPYQNPYQQNPYQQNPYLFKNPEDRGSSKLAYSIKIDMELHPGTSLTPQQISQSKCSNRYNSIRKSFAEFTGRPYVIPPVYPTNPNTRKRQVGGKNVTLKKK